MKKLIRIIALTIVVLAAIYGAAKLYVENRNKTQEKQNLWWALHHEKQDRYDMVVAGAIKELENRMEAIEWESLMKMQSILHDSSTPAVFRYRLSRLQYDGETWDKLLGEVNSALRLVIIFQHVVGAYPAAPVYILRDNFANIHEKKPKVALGAEAEYEALVEAQKVAIRKVNALTEADVPEQRIAWQREVQRSLHK